MATIKRLSVAENRNEQVLRTYTCVSYVFDFLFLSAEYHRNTVNYPYNEQQAYSSVTVTTGTEIYYV